MNKKIVIAYSNVAGGHKSAADAIATALKNISPQTEVLSVDLIKEINKFPFTNLEKSWEWATKYRAVELIVEGVFKISQLDSVHWVYSHLINWRIAPKAKRILDGMNPDAVVSTHLIVSNTLQGVKSRGAKYKTVSVASDLVDFPRPLADKNADLIFAPTDAAAMRFQKFGVDGRKIAYPYFPIDPKMRSYRPKEQVIRELGLDSRKNTILFTGGGLGTISMLPALKKIAEKKDIQVIVAAGKDTQFKEKLTKMFSGLTNIVILGFVSNFQDYINLADLIIAKPGPATIVEIELFEKKAIFTRHIGIQETGNLYYLGRNPNFRSIGNNIDLLLPTLKELLEKKYVPHESRFGFSSAEKMAQKILEIS